VCGCVWVWVLVGVGVWVWESCGSVCGSHCLRATLEISDINGKKNMKKTGGGNLVQHGEGKLLDGGNVRFFSCFF
jgi:hypothetical protein